MTIIEAQGLGKRYGRTWALSNCTLSLPEGRVTALVGPNGAGKTTLQHLLVGLAAPTAGTVSVLGGVAPGSNEALEAVAFVAQDAPLYRHLSVSEMIRLTGYLNPRFDLTLALLRCEELGLPREKKVGKLSGGQQAQLALTLALSRRPRLLILDEPVARLDPLARHELIAFLMVAAAEDGLSILLSSHVVSELERVADHLVVLAAGRVQMVGDIAELLERHRVLIGPADQLAIVERRFRVLEARRGQRQASVLVAGGEGDEVPAGWQAHEVNLEELVLALLRDGRLPEGCRSGLGHVPETARVTA
jgi:ABC-2 type transport system ATP-binding protein